MLMVQRSPFVDELARRVREGAARPWGVELGARFAQDRVLAAYATVEDLSDDSRKSGSDHHREQVP